MLLIRIILILLFLLTMGCFVKNALDKRRNIGFLISAVIIAFGDLLCVALVGVKNAKEASNVLLPLYIKHAWFFFFVLLMVLMIDRYKKLWISLTIVGVFCAYQTYLVISQYFGARVFSFQKRIYLRKAWWVAVDSKFTGLFNSYRSYRVAESLNIVVILIVLLFCIFYTGKILRARYYWLAAVLALFAAGEYMMIRFSLPVWILTMVYNVIFMVCLYLVGDFEKHRLREWSLDSFANDMSDGLILYDKYNDPIHMNDMIKNTLQENLIEDFKDINKLREWIDKSKDPGRDDIITYSNGEGDHYFKVTARDLQGRRSRVGTLFILHDTTDSVNRIKAMEEANRELERASRMKSDFLANMSHELRTPMNAVIGMTEIAMRETDSPQLTDHLYQIQSSGKNLLNIINDILDYSKIESGKMEIIDEEYVPFEEMSQIANVLITRVGDKPLELFVNIEGALPHKLYGDAMRIRQVLINLANNAIKFTREGMVKVNIKYEPADDGMVMVSFHVIDTGVGIKAEDMDKLFVSFQQVDAKRNREVEGTGLGLAIAQKLVEAMGGQIGVESEYGKGSDFWFCIPQKVVDDANDLEVENKSEKHAFVFDRRDMNEMFIREMTYLGVEHSVLSALDDYSPTGGTDYFFFNETSYDDKVKAFLDKNKDLTGVVMVPYGSGFMPDKPNLHTLQRPATSMNMVNILNGRYDDKKDAAKSKAFKADFTAPDARILIVDDNMINLTIAGELIAPLKVQLDTADGGQKAIDMALKNDYDIIFMDHMMPVVDGVSAARAIRAADIKQPVIIALSANAMEEARRLFDEAGMNDFVAKPIDVRLLVSAVRKWLPPELIIENDGTETETEEEEVKVNIERLDIERAVNALGSAALYDKIAGEYYRSGEDKLNAIVKAYNDKDWTDYTIRVHALKSSSRQIGAMELGDMAEALEKAGKADDIETIMADTDRTMEVYRKLLDDLAVYYDEGDEDDDQDKPMIDKAALTAILDELETACNDLDMDGMEDVDNRLKGFAYSEEAKELVNSIHKAISELDTEGCSEYIDKLRSL